MSIDAVELTELDKLLGFEPPSPPTPEQEIDLLAIRLISLREQADTLADQITAIEDAIVARTVDEPGEELLIGDAKVITVARNELWKWDDDKLDAKIPTLPVPEFVKLKFAIDKKKFQAEPEVVQKDFLDALTRKPGSARVKVSDKK